MNSETAHAVQQWIAKAEADWSAVAQLRIGDRCLGAIVCFHCQQRVEKLLKAFLTAHQIEAPRTHDLRRLIQLSREMLPELDQLLDAADMLTIHAVEMRYPGDQPEVTEKEVDEMVEFAQAFAKLLLPKLQVGE